MQPKRFNLITGENDAGKTAYLEKRHDIRWRLETKTNQRYYRRNHTAITPRIFSYEVDEIDIDTSLKYLHLVDDTIIDVNLTTGIPSYTDQDQRMKSFSNRMETGDGIRQALSIFVEMAYARQGHLTIENIDLYFHYSVLTPLWRLIIQEAVNDDITIYATTQNLDCIKSFTQAVEDAGQQENAQLMRFDRNNFQRQNITIYTHEALRIAMSQGVEVR